MATSSYANLFGTTGAGQQGSQAGIGTMFGQQARPRVPSEQQPAQTFAQLQRQGMARPAPSAPQGQPFARFGGSEQAQQARTGMLGQLQQQLAQPTRFDTEAFKQIRQAQSAQLGAEYQAQQSQLNEELARRGLSASSIGGGRMGDLAGQQARALAQLDAQLLQQAAQTQAEDRLRAMQAGAQFAELAGAQDLSQFEANRVAQAAEFEQAMRQAQFQQGQTEFARGQALQAAQVQQTGQETAMDRALRERLGIAELTGEVGGRQTLAAQQQAEQARQFNIQQALQRELGMGGLGIQQAQLGLQERELAQTAALERERLAAQQTQFGQQLGFNREELALRGELGRGEQQIAEARLAQEGRLEEARQGIQLKELGQREAQFQATLGAEEQRFVRTLKEQQEARLQQLGISTKELDLRATQIADEARLRGDEIGLTRARDEAEIEYRGKALEQQELLAGRQITAEAARQQAQLDFQRDQMITEDALRREGIAVDRERLAAAESQFTRQLAQQSAEAAGKVRVGTRFVQQPDGSTVEEPIYEDTVQARQLAQQQRMQEAELKGYFEGPNGTRIDTLATRQLDQARLNALAEQAARQSQLTGFMYKVNKLGQLEIEMGADGKPVTTEARRAQMQQEEQAKLDRELRERLGMGELTGVVGTGANAQQTLAARNAQQQMLVQLASALAQSTNISKEQMENLMRQLYTRMGINNPILTLGGGGGGGGGGGEGGGDDIGGNGATGGEIIPG